MKTDRLFQSLYRLADFPDVLRANTDYGAKFRKHVDGLVVIKNYRRPEILLSAGHRANRMYFLNRGFARAYKYDEKTGDELTDFLWEDPAFVVDPDSFYLQRPSETFLQVWEGEVISASYTDMEETFKLFPEIIMLTRTVAVEHSKFYRRRLDMIRTMDADARYQLLLEEHPRIVQVFPGHIIASFLGIAPGSLSRIKSR